MTDTKISKPNFQFYSVKLEVLAPITLTYRVLAENPEQALTLATKNILINQNEPPKIIWNKLKKISAKIYLAGTSIISLTKKY